MEDAKKGVGKASALLIRSGANNVMLEETDAGPAIIRDKVVYFPWSEVAWELSKDDKIVMVKAKWDTKPIEALLGKWERGTIATTTWEDLEKAKVKMEAKAVANANKPELKSGKSPIPGDPGKTAEKTAEKATGKDSKVGKAVEPPPPPKAQGKGKPSGPVPIPKATATPPEPPAPVWVEQDSYRFGVREQVDSNLYTNHIKCENCGADRWTKIQDAFQVTKCKPCAKRDRRKRRAANKKAKAKAKAAVATAPVVKKATVPLPKKSAVATATAPKRTNKK